MTGLWPARRNALQSATLQDSRLIKAEALAASPSCTPVSLNPTQHETSLSPAFELDTIQGVPGGMCQTSGERSLF